MKQSSGLKRNTIDKFYTSPNVVEKCYDILVEILNINFHDDLIIEPSAGNGAFVEIIKKLCDNYKLYDISPDSEIIEKQNYLELNTDSFQPLYNKIHVIGNPPFGRQSSLAIQFIKKSAIFCDTISFILPKSFKKESLKDKVALNFHCIYQCDLPNNSFLLNNMEYGVPCVFQIWEKRDINRKKLPILVENGFKFVKKEDTPDIFIYSTLYYKIIYTYFYKSSNIYFYYSIYLFYFYYPHQKFDNNYFLYYYYDSVLQCRTRRTNNIS